MTDITGRDGYIIAKALAYASAWIASLPELYDEVSDREDMDAILLAMTSQADSDALHETARKTLRDAHRHAVAALFYLPETVETLALMAVGTQAKMLTLKAARYAAAEAEAAEG